MKLRLYNPWNDLALATNAVQYTPPQAAVRLARAGQTLPLWYGDEGDKVLCHGVNAEWYDRVRADFGIGVELWDHTVTPDLQPDPWGWSLAARQTFIDEGFTPEMLPSAQSIERMRQLSHRRTGISVARYVREALGGQWLTGMGEEVDDPSKLEAVIKGYDGQVYLKQPWSSSGRGVMTTTRGYRPAVRFGVESIAKQGSVIVEPAHRKQFEFALIYTCQGGKCAFDSTSVFVTDEHDAYCGNFLATEPERQQCVIREMASSSGSTMVDRTILLEQLCASVRQGIEELIAPHYDGVVGVDMLLTPDGLIDPVVEVNVRKTMGYVANRFADRYLAPGSRGTLRPAIPKQSHEGPNFMSSNYLADGHRLVSGQLSLTPPDLHFAFVALANNS